MAILYGKQQRGSQVGGPGSEPVPNKLSVGNVITLSPGSKAAVEITGDAPAQVINFSLPAGKDGTSPALKIGKVTTLAAGSPATVTLGGTAPDYTVISASLKVTPEPIQRLFSLKWYQAL